MQKGWHINHPFYIISILVNLFSAGEFGEEAEDFEI